MYSIYVTNKSDSFVLVRLQRRSISDEHPTFIDELEDKLRAEDKNVNVSPFLVKWRFCLIPPQQTMPFSIDLAHDGPRTFATLFVGSRLWIMDHELNFMRYGCLFVKSTPQALAAVYHLSQANPEPVWIPAKNGDALPANVVKAGSQAYFGRSSNGGTPCSVIVTGSEISTWDAMQGYLESSGELLSDTGHEFVRAKSGDLVPPNAVIGGATEPEGSLYLGRIGGTTPCSISSEKGRIKSFYYGSKKVQSGEILVLTNDPANIH